MHILFSLCLNSFYFLFDYNGGYENMKMKKNAIPMLAVLTVLGIFGATFVAAYQGGFMGGMNDDEHSAIQTAIQNNDYATWKSAIESTLTEERFQELRTREAEMQTKRTDMETRRAAIEAALNAKDYAAWKEAIGSSGSESKLADVITEENFSLYVDMHEAMKSGDFEKAKEIREDLGLSEGHSFGTGFGMMKRGMHKAAD